MSFDHSSYNLNRYHKIMTEARGLLGAKCALCGSTKDLQFDRIDRKTKTYEVTRFKSVQSLFEELKKCQLLCRACHIDKSIAERGLKPARGTHGTLSSYRYCKCEKCRAARSKYMKEYQKKRLAS